MNLPQLFAFKSSIETVIEERQNIFALSTDHLRPYQSAKDEFTKKTLPELNDMLANVKKEIDSRKKQL